MKKIKHSVIITMVAVFSFASATKIKAQEVSVNFSVFQQELSPYGRWINNPRFGQVWIYNDADFRPYYTDGHWEYTNYGWAWVSDYDWGWAPFHYGRWEYDPYYGWMWIPGYEWASAWVSWSSYDDYYGWAPLGYGVSLNVTFGAIPYDRWTFIPRRNICDRDINRYYVSPQRNYQFRNAVVINNYYNGGGRVGRYYRGPERREVEHYTNNRITERRIDYNTWNRDRNEHNRNSNANNNGRRNNDRVNQNGNAVNGNNGRRNDVNRGNDHTPVFENRKPQNTSRDNQNNPRRRDVRPDVNTQVPPVRENRRPQRNGNSFPQTNNNNPPGRTQNESRPNRSYDQHNNFPQERQQAERAAPPQQRSMERRDNGNRNIQRSNSENNQRGAGNIRRGKG